MPPRPDAGGEVPEAKADDPGSLLAPDAPEGLRKAARGEKVTPEDEATALAWLASGAKPLQYTVLLDFDTEDGTKQIPWRVRSMDGDKIDEIEKKHTTDDSPLNFKMDEKAANIDLIVAATVFPDVHAAAFRTSAALTPEGEPTTITFASPQQAIEHYFRFQSGLIAGLASRIRTVSGWNPERVGKASTVLVNAVGK